MDIQTVSIEKLHKMVDHLADETQVEQAYAALYQILNPLTEAELQAIESGERSLAEEGSVPLDVVVVEINERFKTGYYAKKVHG